MLLLPKEGLVPLAAFVMAEQRDETGDRNMKKHGQARDCRHGRIRRYPLCCSRAASPFGKLPRSSQHSRPLAQVHASHLLGWCFHDHHEVCVLGSRAVTARSLWVCPFFGVATFCRLDAASRYRSRASFSVNVNCWCSYMQRRHCSRRANVVCGQKSCATCWLPQ